MKKILILSLFFLGCKTTQSPAQSGRADNTTIFIESTETEACSDFGNSFQYSRDYMVQVDEIVTLRSFEFQIDFDDTEIDSASFDIINSVLSENLSSADFTSRTNLNVTVESDEARALIPGAVYRLGCLYFSLKDKRPLESTVVTRYFLWDGNHIAGFEIPDIALNTLTGDFSTEPVDNTPGNDEGGAPTDSTVYVNVPDDLNFKISTYENGEIVFELVPIENTIFVITKIEGKLRVELIKNNVQNP